MWTQKSWDLHRDPILSKSLVFSELSRIICSVLCVHVCERKWDSKLKIFPPTLLLTTGTSCLHNQLFAMLEWLCPCYQKSFSQVWTGGKKIDFWIAIQISSNLLLWTALQWLFWVYNPMPWVCHCVQGINSVWAIYPLCFSTWMKCCKYTLPAENQKGANTVKWCSIENQKGANTVKWCYLRTRRALTLLNDFHWEPEGRYRHRLCTMIAAFWFSMEHHWTASSLSQLII